MREILFRGKREINNEWAFGHYIVLDPIDKPEKIRKPLHLIIPIESKFNSWNGYLFTRYPIIPETLGQFTGLLDRNGEKIFEGDIIKCEITYEAGCYPHTETEIREVKYGAAYPLHYCHNPEVIGNIHDNPELLKKEEK